jgi:hypothetical protein
MKILSRKSKRNQRSRLIQIFMVISCVALLLTGVFSTTVSAASSTVSAGQSIQSAINSASSGDVININPGTYTGALSITKGGLTLQKTPGSSGSVIIDGNKASYAISLSNASNTVLNGLTVRNSNYTDISASDSNSCKILNCNIAEWALVGTSSTDSNRAGICIGNGSGWTIQGNYMNRGNHDGPQIDSEYDDPHDISGILVMGGSGEHQILDNVFYGAYQSGSSWRFSVNDFLSNDDWNQPNSSWNNSTISGNQFYGSFDEVIQLDGNNNNITVTNNYIDGLGARALISVNPCYSGPVNIKDNLMKHWRSSNVAMKMGAFTGSANGTKNIGSNTFWNNGGYVMGGTNGSAGGVYFSDNKIHSGTKTSYKISFAQNSGNTTTSFAEPTLADWKGGTITFVPDS